MVISDRPPGLPTSEIRLPKPKPPGMAVRFKIGAHAILLMRNLPPPFPWTFPLLLYTFLKENVENCQDVEADCLDDLIIFSTGI